MKTTVQEIKSYYRKMLKEKGKYNKPAERFVDPFSKKEIENLIGIPVALLNKLLKEKA